jgi:hypothetical protein
VSDNFKFPISNNLLIFTVVSFILVSEELDDENCILAVVIKVLNKVILDLQIFLK